MRPTDLWWDWRKSGRLSWNNGRVLVQCHEDQIGQERWIGHNRVSGNRSSNGGVGGLFLHGKLGDPSHIRHLPARLI